MNIAIVMNPPAKEIGGGYSLQMNWVGSLFENKDLWGNHSFSVICHSGNEGMRKVYPTIDYIDMPSWVDLQVLKVSLVECFRLKIGHAVQRVLKYFYIESDLLFEKSIITPNIENDYQEYLKKHDIDYIWYPDLSCVPILDFPYVVTIWDVDHLVTPFFPELSVNNEWDHREKRNKPIIRRSSKVFIGTEVGKKQIVEFYNKQSKDIEVVPFPAFVHVYDNIVEEKPVALAGIVEFFFYPAQFWPHKNHVCILDALKILKNEGLESKVVFSGSDQGNMEYIKNYAKSIGVLGNCVFLGFVSNNEIKYLYQNCISLIFSSHNGPDNLPPLEAFVNDCPVICSNYPGAFDQLGDSVHIFPSDSPSSLAKAMIKLSNDETYRVELVEKGQAKAKEKNLRSSIKKTMSVFNELTYTRKSWAGSHYIGV